MNCNVLVVDDSPVLRAAIRKVAKLAGVEEDQIFEAGNGQEALDDLVLRSSRPATVRKPSTSWRPSGSISCCST